MPHTLPALLALLQKQGQRKFGAAIPARFSLAYPQRTRALLALLQKQSSPSLVGMVALQAYHTRGMPFFLSFAPFFEGGPGTFPHKKKHWTS
jgi:hypothetical protein